MQNITTTFWPGGLSPVLAKVFAEWSSRKSSVESTESSGREVIAIPWHEKPDAAEDKNSPHRPEILVPMDFSPASARAVDYAIEVARRSRGRLILLHVVYLNLTPFGPANSAWLREALCREALEKMEATMVRAQQAGVPVISAIEEGSPAKTIADVAKRWKTDLLVLSSHKRGKWAAFFGSHVKEKVVRMAKCPIVVIETGLRKGAAL